MLQELVSRGITAFAMQSNLSIGDFGWGSETFHKMVCHLSFVFGSIQASICCGLGCENAIAYVYVLPI